MGVYANGHLIFGFVHDKETEALFEKIIEKGTASFLEENEDEKPEEGYEVHIAFEELYEKAQKKHKIRLRSIGYAGVDIVSAFDVGTGSKEFSYEKIESKKMNLEEEYKERIQSFLSEVEIETSCVPGWYILGYMD